MATNWSYIPFIGTPISLENGAGDDIPQDTSLPGLFGPPRENTLKTYFELLSQNTLTYADDSTVLLTVRAPRVVSAADIANTDGSKGVNNNVPIVTFTAGTGTGSTAGWRFENALFTADSDIVLLTFLMQNPAAFPCESYFCIDFSHSIVN